MTTDHHDPATTADLAAVSVGPVDAYGTSWEWICWRCDTGGTVPTKSAAKAEAIRHRWSTKHLSRRSSLSSKHYAGSRANKHQPTAMEAGRES